MFGFGFNIGGGFNTGGYFNPVVIGFPQITSEEDPIIVGSTLDCSTGTWIPLYEPITFSYQWYKNGVLIGGATGVSYTTSSDGIYVCYVTATNDLGNSTTVPSNTIFIGSFFIISEDGFQLITEDDNIIISQ